MGISEMGEDSLWRCWRKPQAAGGSAGAGGSQEAVIRASINDMPH